MPFVLAAVLLSLSSEAAPAYLRYPDLCRDVIVFFAEGDLWTVPATGGEARRITSAPGEERFPRFSPDCASIAFTARYDGNDDAYVMPAAGGEPQRITWHPEVDEVMGWWPDGSSVIFRTRAEDPHGRSYHLYTVPPGGGDARELPLGWAGNLDVDPATGRWAFVRMGWEHRTWKRYRGGTAPDLWVGDPEKADFRRISTFEGTDAFPMWHDGRVTFLSDEGGTANLWSSAPDGTDRRRHTHGDTWDVRWPAMAPDGRVVYMLAGDLVVWDPGAGASRTLEITLPSERILARTRYPDPLGTLTWWTVSPQGDRLLLTTRGEVISVPVEPGVTLPVTRGSGARESWASFAPDGRRVVYVTDESGEQAIVTADAWGRGDVATVLPPSPGRWHLPPAWSPDGKWIAWSDQTYTLRVAPAAGGEVRDIDRSDQWEITQYAWSPDGRWLAYVRTDRRSFSSIWIWDSRTGKTHRVTGLHTHDHSPAWDPEGRFLYFLSDRTMNPVLGNRDFAYIQDRTTRPYVLLLRPGVQNPFLHQEGLPTTEEELTRAQRRKQRRQARKLGVAEEAPWAPRPVEIVFEQIEDRVVAFPVDAGNYGSLRATSHTVFWLSQTTRGMGEKPARGGTLVAFSLEDEEPADWMSGVTGFELAFRAGRIAVHKEDGTFRVLDAAAPPPADTSDAVVSVADGVVELDPREEWRQIFLEGWRLMRDFYWEEDLGGLDWEAIRDRYAALLPRIATRGDLTDLMGEVIGELATSHTYLWGGDPGVTPPTVSTGLLGADLVREGEAFRVARILKGDAADTVRSPLAEPGVDVREGHYILSVHHQPFRPDRPFLASLQAQAGRAVVLTVSDRAPGTKGAVQRDVVVVPLESEQPLRYADWVRRNREAVTTASDGRIGYLHIPDMGSRGLMAFERWFYPQLDKQGLVVDVRWNGGGFVSQLILERFRRTVIAVDRARGGGLWTYPEKVLNGPFVVLTNEFAGSDGDIFPQAVQVEGLAPVIGRRSWGGVVGIRGDKPLIDAGMITQPEFAFWFPKKGWGLENRGVEPDIEVENPPQDVAAGRDPQLERAVQEVLRLREEGTWFEPAFEPPPVKTREHFREKER
ncbi:MAG: PD40 domain-containing protein [Deltaproteobacteria bacterium]|nr:PD40 domain-containing protein [Deltaproteobacteria bacterium]